MPVRQSALRAAIAVAVVVLAACSPSGTGAVPEFDGSHVSADAWAAAAEQPGVVILDVRTPEEFAEGHVPGAILVNLNSGAFEAEVSALDPSASYAVYCRSGNRSRVAIDAMTRLGFGSTVGLEGGIGAWAAAGFAVATG